MSPNTSQTGFTIVELMIATSVFSVVLLIFLASIMGINKIYTKGTTAAQTQDVARSVMDSVKQSIELTPGAISAQAAPNYTICTGQDEYTLSLGQIVDATAHGLLTSSIPGGCTASTPRATNGTELLSSNMRLSQLTVTSLSATNDFYAIKVRVVYGAADLFCVDDGSTTDPYGCSNPSPTELTDSLITSLSTTQLAQLHCKSGSGNEFCATAQSNTLVERRMQQQ